MHEADKREFAKLLQATAEYYDRKLAPQTLAIYWSGLVDLTLDQVRAALNVHAQDTQAGQYMPKIADIRRAIESNRDDGHPGPDEAWAIAMQAKHETASIVWTPQISAAFFAAALPLLDEGDKIAARKAFIERYERELSEARRAGVQARWIASLGSDPAYRVQAVENAIRAGRITQEHAQRLLPSPEPEPDAIRRLENGAKNRGISPEESARRLAALRKLLGQS